LEEPQSISDLVTFINFLLQIDAGLIFTYARRVIQEEMLNKRKTIVNIFLDGASPGK
jgi:hypothetical protein